jgi:hypothetical protein
MKTTEPQPEEWVAKLIRLKRYETPGADYFERFLDDFRERQRAEALRLSVGTLAVERFVTWWESVPMAGRWASASALCAMPLAAGFLWFHESPLEAPERASIPKHLPALAEVSLVREF